MFCMPMTRRPGVDVSLATQAAEHAHSSCLAEQHPRCRRNRSGPKPGCQAARPSSFHCLPVLAFARGPAASTRAVRAAVANAVHKLGVEAVLDAIRPFRKFSAAPRTDAIGPWANSVWLIFSRGTPGKRPSVGYQKPPSSRRRSRRARATVPARRSRRPMGPWSNRPGQRFIGGCRTRAVTQLVGSR
jgi:hypothetical protein